MDLMTCLQFERPAVIRKIAEHPEAQFLGLVIILRGRLMLGHGQHVSGFKRLLDPSLFPRLASDGSD